MARPSKSAGKTGDATARKAGPARARKTAQGSAPANEIASNRIVIDVQGRSIAKTMKTAQRGSKQRVAADLDSANRQKTSNVLRPSAAEHKPRRAKAPVRKRGHSRTDETTLLKLQLDAAVVHYGTALAYRFNWTGAPSKY
jgi:hypothetical protein